MREILPPFPCYQNVTRVGYISSEECLELLLEVRGTEGET